MASGAELLGHEVWGAGPERVMLLNDWLCDTSTWDAARPYLDPVSFSFCFADLRGYGRSKSLTGRYTIDEACEDVSSLREAFAWETFTLVGHSMSSLIALRFAQLHGERLKSLVLLAPPPPRGFGVGEDVLTWMRGVALAGDQERATALASQFSQELGPHWAAFKLRRWRETAEPVAAAAYCAMFARDGLPEPERRVTTRTLALTGETDALPMRAASARKSLATLCPNLEVVPIATSGHYPMQEVPALTASLVQQFIGVA